MVIGKLRSGVIQAMDVFKLGFIDVGVDLRSSDIGVAQ